MDKALEAILHWWDVSGVDVPDLPPAPRRKAKPAAPASERPAKPKPVARVKPQAPAPSGPSSSEVVANVKTIAELSEAIRSFDAGALSDHARQAVISRGNADADIMVIGEAPGRDEDIQGKPFVGRSGQLLDKILASIGLNEDNFYITNVVNWRPPQNRTPNTEELMMCKPFIFKHIELFDPKMIVLVGGISLQAIMDISGIMRNRGQWMELPVNGKTVPVLPIYHPAFLLRQPALKKDAWRDMLSLIDKLDAL